MISKQLTSLVAKITRHAVSPKCAASSLALMVICASAFATDVPKINPPLHASPLRQGVPVGFVTHPRDGHLEELADFPATAELSNMFCWVTKKKFESTDDVKLNDIEVEFGAPSDWLRKVYSSRRVAYPILDIGIQHSDNPWRAAMTGRVGENLVGYDGKLQAWSSLHSPLFRKSSTYYVDQLIDWIKLNDTEHRIPGYIMGAEWFWPYGTQDYSPMALDAFRTWLKTKYRSLDRLNQAWGSSFKDWGTVDPPRMWMIGEDAIGLKTFSIGRPSVLNWSSPGIPVQPGVEYTISTTAFTEDVPEGLCVLALSWLDKSGKQIKEIPYSLKNSAKSGVILFKAEAPGNASTARVILRLHGQGKATFTKPCIKISAASANLAGSKGGSQWTFTKELGEGTGRFALSNGQSEFIIAAKTQKLSFKHSGVALEDWNVFSFEAMAKWMNDSTRHVKERDPSRITSSYVGWVFGSMSAWDGMQMEQRLDISLCNTPDIDVNGFQMAIAGDDFTYATFLLDMARKYGKPMWCTDLIDFPYGLYSGFEPIYRASMACVQHGMDGFFYYCWYGAAPLDYNYSGMLAKPDLDRLLRDDSSSIEALKNYQIRTDVAELAPMMTYSLADDGGYKGDMLDSGGLYHLVLDMGFTPDIWTPYEIARKGSNALGTYKVLFVSDCPVLPLEVNKALVDFVRAGGVVIGSGRPPVKDPAGMNLPERLVAECIASANGDKLYKHDFGAGKVIWMNEKVGRKYWGEVRRVQVHGNTPAMFVEDADPNRTPYSRRLAREKVTNLMADAGVRLPAVVDSGPGDINLTFYQKTNSNDCLAFLVHTGKGRSEDVTLTLDRKLAGKPCEARVDLDRRIPVTITEDGRVAVPSFAHSCLVFIGTASLEPGM